MAGFNLDSLMGRNRDYARGYTFYVYIDNPVASVGYGDKPYLVKGTSLPTSTSEPIKASWQGNEYKVAGVQSFTEWKVTFMCDPNDIIRKEMVDWMRLCHDPKTNRHGQPRDYMRDQIVSHISHYDGVPIMEYTLKGAFPKAVDELAMDYGTKELASFGVSFEYQYFTTI